MYRPYRRAEISFSIISEIQREDGNSKIYICHDPQLDTDIVIKRLEKSRFTNVDDFFNESRTLYLSKHPFVVQVLYACEDSDYIYLAMPYYRNGSINRLIDERFITVREIIRFSTQFLTGLQNIHTKRLIHFDIKPSNILLSERSEAMISDFGQAKFTNFNGVAGQDRLYLRQLPPEAFDSDILNVGLDIYQSGVTIYRMCNGNEVFNRQFSQYGDQSSFDRDAFRFDVRVGRFPNRDIYPYHIPSKLKRIIKKCLNVDVGVRYTSAIDILNDLADISGNELDWKFTRDEHVETWIKDLGNKKHFLGVRDSGEALAKKIFRNGREQRITRYCRDNITREEIVEFLREN